MNYDILKAALEFNKDLANYNELYYKYNIVNYYKNIIFLLDNNEETMKRNIIVIKNEINKIGYTISECSNYNELSVQLNVIIDDINNKVNELYLNKAMNKMVETRLKRMFKY